MAITLIVISIFTGKHGKYQAAVNCNVAHAVESGFLALDIVKLSYLAGYIATYLTSYLMLAVLGTGKRKQILEDEYAGFGPAFGHHDKQLLVKLLQIWCQCNTMSRDVWQATFHHDLLLRRGFKMVV